MCPTDLTTAQAAATTKIIGADPSTGVEDNYFEVFSDGSTGIRNSFKEAQGTSGTNGAVLLSVDAAGFAIAYVQLTAVAGTTANASVICQCSNDNVEWFEITTVLSSIPVFAQQQINCIAGNLDTRSLMKVDLLGRYFRILLTSDGGTGTVTAKAYLSASDSFDSLGRANTVYITDSSGNMLNTDNNELGVHDNTGNASLASIDSKLNALGQTTKSASVPVTMASDQGALEVKPGISTRADTYTGTTTGTIVDVSAKGCKSYALQVLQTGTVTSWDVRLEGSIDGINFTQILQHTQVTGTGVTVFSGANLAPALYIRTKCASIVLGAGTNVVASLLGMN